MGIHVSKIIGIRELIEELSGGGGGGATVLDDLSDVAISSYTDGKVLRADGTGFVDAVLAHSDLSGVGTNAHSVIDTHLASTSNPHSVTAAQVSAVPLSGSASITGLKTFATLPQSSAVPTNADDLVNKAYSDALAAGFRYKDAAQAATTAALTATYANGTLGVGATLTATGNGAFGTLDGYATQANDRILVKNQAAPAQNGMYSLTTVGDGSNPWVLTRTTDYDASADMAQGTTFLILNGTVGLGTQWAQSTADLPTVGTTAITYIQVGQPIVYIAGDGLDLTGTTFSLDIKANDGLVIKSTEIGVDYDDSSIGIVTNKLAVKALGITSAMLAGSIGDSKLATITAAGKVSGAALTLLPNIPSGAGKVPVANLGSGTPDGTKFLRDDGTFAVPAGVSNGQGQFTSMIPIHSSPTASLTWTNMPAAVTELAANTFSRVKGDLTYATQYRVIVNQIVAGAAGADFNLQYSTDGTTFQAADTGGAGECAVGTGTGVKSGAWTNLVSGAKADVHLRIVGKDGDAVADPQWREILVEFRSAVAAAPTDATYIVQTASSGLSAEQALGALATGMLKNTTTTGVLSIGTAGTDYTSPTSTETMTNKRITKRSGTTTSSATPTINTDNVDFYSLTAQTADITSFTTNLTGTPVEGDTLWIAITGTAARAITWGASFEASGGVALPTTTVTTARLDVGFVWNTVTSKWRCVASA